MSLNRTGHRVWAWTKTWGTFSLLSESGSLTVTKVTPGGGGPLYIAVAAQKGKPSGGGTCLNRKSETRKNHHSNSANTYGSLICFYPAWIVALNCLGDVFRFLLVLFLLLPILCSLGLANYMHAMRASSHSTQGGVMCDWMSMYAEYILKVEK